VVFCRAGLISRAIDLYFSVHSYEELLKIKITNVKFILFKNLKNTHMHTAVFTIRKLCILAITTFRLNMYMCDGA